IKDPKACSTRRSSNDKGTSPTGPSGHDQRVQEFEDVLQLQEPGQVGEVASDHQRGDTDGVD
ncbi:hypothetical protein BGZ72_009854, partial [Mortierella alpina]